MFKLIILLVKKETMSDEEFAKYSLTKHAPLASKMPGLKRYVINVTTRPPNKEPEYHSCAELWFDDKESMKTAFSSPEGRATQADTQMFASKTITLFVEEHTIT